MEIWNDEWLSFHFVAARFRAKSAFRYFFLRISLFRLKVLFSALSTLHSEVDFVSRKTIIEGSSGRDRGQQSDSPSARNSDLENEKVKRSCRSKIVLDGLKL